MSTFISKQDGNWHDPNTWNLNRIPDIDDDVTVQGGHKINMGDAGNGACACHNLTCESNATIEISSSGTIDLGGSGKEELLKKLKKVKIKKIIGKKLNKKDKELLKDWDKKNYGKYGWDKGSCSQSWTKGSGSLTLAGNTSCNGLTIAGDLDI